MPTISMFYRILVSIYRDELLADWELAVAGDEPYRIAPLQ